MSADAPKGKIQVLKTDGDAASSETCQTYVIQGEDHTLGNALRYMIMKNPDVQMCGYTEPHPSSGRIHLRIQTYSVPPIDVLEKGLNDLYNVCEHALDTFEASVKDFKDQNEDSSGMETS